ncbi:MAG TPA: DUF4124 domain-containing protein [Steroidobacteraceae bacterium]|jgi:redox-sensitive bicupin YhaK (pirin superfamily)|nr:DUF4124 domain-containing protein [Steroidobacteraceae bacterium]
MRPIRFTLIRSAALACLGLLSAAALADNGGTTTVYKWVDAQGVVHYSDQPHPNAQKLEVRGAQTFAALPVESTSSAPAPQETQSSAAAYQGCAITEPTDQQTLMNVQQATAVVQASPQLRPSDQIRLFVDGKQISGSGTSFTFPVFRGQHSVQAVIEDNTGQIVCETSTVTFFVHQPSVQNPHNPVHPR